LNLIDVELLSNADKAYINSYHKRVWETMGPVLKDDKESLEWLEHATRAI
jgi:Xaa-Pro aminopeptidase